MTFRDKPRAEAMTAGCKFYIGSVCNADPSHGNIRYTTNASCVQCVRISNGPEAKRERARKRDPKVVLKSDPTGYHRPVFVLGDPISVNIWLKMPVWKAA